MGSLNAPSHYSVRVMNPSAKPRPSSGVLPSATITLSVFAVAGVLHLFPLAAPVIAQDGYGQITYTAGDAERVVVSSKRLTGDQLERILRVERRDDEDPANRSSYYTLLDGSGVADEVTLEQTYLAFAKLLVGDTGPAEELVGGSTGSEEAAFRGFFDSNAFTLSASISDDGIGIGAGWNDAEPMVNGIAYAGFTGCSGEPAECNASFGYADNDEGFGLKAINGVFRPQGNATAAEVSDNLFLTLDFSTNPGPAGKRAAASDPFCSATIFSGDLRKPDNSPTAYVLSDSLDTIIACGDISDPYFITAQLTGAGNQTVRGMWATDGKLFAAAQSTQPNFVSYDPENSGVPIFINNASASILAYDAQTLEYLFARRLTGPADQFIVNTSTDPYGNTAVLSTYDDSGNTKSRVALYNSLGDTLQVFDNFGNGVQAQSIDMIGSIAHIGGVVHDGGSLNTINPWSETPPNGLPSLFHASLPFAYEVHQAFAPLAADAISYQGGGTNISQSLAAGDAGAAVSFAVAIPAIFVGQTGFYPDATEAGFYAHVGSFTAAFPLPEGNPGTVAARFVNATGSSDPVVVEIHNNSDSATESIANETGVQILLDGYTGYAPVFFISGAGSSERVAYRLASPIGSSTLDFTVVLTPASGKSAATPGVLVYDTIGRHLAVDVVTAIDPGESQRRMAILSIFPNPIRSTATIAYTGDGADAADIRIFDVTGRVVRRLEITAATPGPQSAVWDGRNDAGQVVGSGVYFVRIQTGESVDSRAVVVRR